MVFSANELPSSTDLTDGFFSRWVILPFDWPQIEAGREDPRIESRLHEELEGILVKALDGLRRVTDRRRFMLTESVAEATDRYRETADPVRVFVSERLELIPEERVRRPVVYEKYREWCASNGHEPLSAKRFYPALERIDGIRQEKSGDRWIRGVKLRSPRAWARWA